MVQSYIFLVTIHSIEKNIDLKVKLKMFWYITWKQ